MEIDCKLSFKLILIYMSHKGGDDSMFRSTLIERAV